MTKTTTTTDATLAQTTRVPFLEGETWRAAILNGEPISDLEVSDHGRLRRASTGRIVPDSHNGYGYRKARIGHRTVRVHRVVAWTFLGGPPSASLLAGADNWIVQHVNRDRADNRLSNLRWMSQRANMRHDLGRCPLLRHGGPPLSRAERSRRIAEANRRRRGRPNPRTSQALRGNRNREKFDAEFRENALALVWIGCSFRLASRILGCSPTAVRRWHHGRRTDRPAWRPRESGAA